MEDQAQKVNNEDLKPDVIRQDNEAVRQTKEIHEKNENAKPEENAEPVNNKEMNPDNINQNNAKVEQTK